MAITNAALSYLAGCIVGTGTHFDAANSYVGVGNGVTAFAVGQTDLVGANKYRQKVDAGYPVVAGPKVTFKATFAPAVANFAWEEWGIFNASSGGVMLNRTAESNSTKLSNQTWILEVDVTFVTA